MKYYYIIVVLSGLLTLLYSMKGMTSQASPIETKVSVPKEIVEYNRSIRRVFTELWLNTMEDEYFHKQFIPHEKRFEYASKICLEGCPQDFIQQYKKYLDVIKKQGKENPGREEEAFWDMLSFARDNYKVKYQEFLSYYLSNEKYNKLLEKNGNEKEIRDLFKALREDLMGKIGKTYPEKIEVIE